MLALAAIAVSLIATRRAPGRAEDTAPAPVARAPVKTFGALHPVASNPEALAEYERAMADLRDAVRNPQVGLGRAVALDPDFAAAQLRLAFATWQPASTRYYREAVRRRDRLDARDLELLAAEEPSGLFPARPTTARASSSTGRCSRGAATTSRCAGGSRGC